MTGQIIVTIVALRPFHAQTRISFNARAGHYSGGHFLCHNLPVAREVFKPSTDSARRLVSTKKNIFSFAFGVLLGGRHKWGCFCVFVVNFTDVYTMRGFLCIFVYIWITASSPGSWPMKPISWLKVFLDSRLEYESLEGLMYFLAFLVQNNGKIIRN